MGDLIDPVLFRFHLGTTPPTTVHPSGKGPVPVWGIWQVGRGNYHPSPSPPGPTVSPVHHPPVHPAHSTHPGSSPPPSPLQSPACPGKVPPCGEGGGGGRWGSGPNLSGVWESGKGRVGNELGDNQGTRPVHLNQTVQSCLSVCLGGERWGGVQWGICLYLPGSLPEWEFTHSLDRQECPPAHACLSVLGNGGGAGMPVCLGTLSSSPTYPPISCQTAGQVRLGSQVIQRVQSGKGKGWGWGGGNPKLGNN